MIVKVNFGEKAFFSHVFLMGITNYRDMFVVFNDDKEKFELVCSTKELDLSKRCIYTFDYTYENFIKRDVMELGSIKLSNIGLVQDQLIKTGMDFHYHILMS